MADSTPDRLASRRRREAVRRATCLQPRAQRAGRRGVQRRGRLPHRPLPGQGDGPEPAGAAVRQHAVRADLERQLRRLGADHHGRGRRHRRPGRLLRQDRRRPRRAAEPPAAAARADRDGGAGRVSTPRRSGPRRSRCSARSRCPTTSTTYAVRGQYEQGWLAGQRVQGYLQEEDVPTTRPPRPTPRSGSASRPAAGPACRSTCAPASGCRAGSPRSRWCSRRRRTCRSPTPTPRSWATTSW